MRQLDFFAIDLEMPIEFGHATDHVVIFIDLSKRVI